MFKPGQVIPCCRLRVKLNNHKNPVELEHKVDLLGTKGPQKFFTITCSPQGKHQGYMILCQMYTLYVSIGKCLEYAVEKSARVTVGKRKQSEDKQHSK